MILKKLFEADNSGSISEEDLAHIIETQAQPFLASSGGHLAYSGRNKDDDFFIGQYRTDRKPLDTDLILDRIINKHLADKGLNLRSNSIFITGSMHRAAAYGKPFIIFPLGDIKYHWYENIPDLTIYLEKYTTVDPYEIFVYYYQNGLVSYEQIETNFLDYVIRIKRDKFLNRIKDKDYTVEQKLQVISDILYEGYTTGIPLHNYRIKNDLFKGFPENAPYDYIWDKHSKDIKIVSDEPLSKIISDDIGEVVINSTEGYLAIAPDVFLLEVFPKMQNAFELDTDIMNMVTHRMIKLLSKIVPEFNVKLLAMYKKWIDDLKSDNDERMPDKEYYVNMLYKSCAAQIENETLKKKFKYTEPDLGDITNLRVFLTDNDDVLKYIKDNVRPLLDTPIHQKVFSKVWDIKL